MSEFQIATLCIEANLKRLSSLTGDQFRGLIASHQSASDFLNSLFRQTTTTTSVVIYRQYVGLECAGKRAMIEIPVPLQVLLQDSDDQAYRVRISHYSQEGR